MSLPIVWWVVLPLVVVQLALWKRRAGTFLWTLATWFSILVFLRFGFTVPVPRSVTTLYLGIATLATIAYVTSSRERLAGFTGPLVRLCVEPKRRPLLYAVVFLLPALAAFGVWRRMNVKLEAPAFPRTIHPAPPDAITVHDTQFNLVTLENPYRALEKTNPAEFASHLADGKRVFYQNCVYCHGDALRGDGMFAHGLNPIPTNFADGGAIALLQESFLFWRISKGGPGLPEEGGPWDTAMPAWEKFLTEDEMWDVILFLYDYSGQRPRAREVRE
ncbi:MAG TPA: cytochrome c [Thermoanaerobaculia bacterium]|nr:cytochrome c [Thermoanaerobaculia bacterium]